eukprot:TRINITY_DN16154_c0_g1_i5.p2 TRINITY_DN16154_c0_g1~~TRINITY_DN16154_c0_g1_i5.p2  ORF type:complete len:179 (+),score=44.65 TRINITY_DN16154_c0_g1_i5:1217-1753(+)
MPDREYGPLRLSAGGTSVAIWALNGNDEEQMQAGLDRLERELRNSKASWRVVVNHNPVVSGGWAHGAQTGKGVWREKTRRLAKMLLPVLYRGGVDAYFAADDHGLQVLVKDGTLHAVSGAGGGSVRFHAAIMINETLWHSVRQQTGFMRHCFSRARLRTVVVAGNGTVLYEHQHPPRG